MSQPSTTIESAARGRDRWLSIATDWAGYQAMLTIRGERGSPRIIYRDGRMTLVSPGFPHELIKERLGRLVDMVILGLKIPATPAGQTTFRSKSRRGGVEGDKTYYFANAARIQGKTRIDLRVDPPPDLAIEVVVSHPVKDALTVYQRLGVPEVWVCDPRSVRILILQADQTYRESPASVVLSMLTADMIDDWVHRPLPGDESEWLSDLYEWVFKVLAPQHRAGEPRP